MIVALTFEQGATIFGIVMTILGVISQAIYLVRKFTQSEARITNDVARVTAAVATQGEQTTKEMKALADAHVAGLSRVEANTKATIEHHNELSTLRFDEMGRRITRVENTLGTITKVVVFDGGQKT